MTSEYRDGFLKMLKEFSENYDFDSDSDFEALSNIINLLDESKESDEEILNIIGSLVRKIDSKKNNSSKDNNTVIKSNDSTGCKKDFRNNWDDACKNYYHYGSLNYDPEYIDINPIFGNGYKYQSLSNLVHKFISYRIICPKEVDNNYEYRDR